MQANAACQSGLMFSVIDRNMGPYKRFTALALKCSQDKTDVRPTMLELVRELENIVSKLPESDTVQFGVGCLQFWNIRIYHLISLCEKEPLCVHGYPRK
ncbi:hypothetical protein Acr_03g0006550 [Actinidia rufa]|uniref:Leucine-rich repeat protein kinase family protein n=1 Tax=Actinidia rufa TaxID=165716 RepID=A0A7J0EBK7_9ERIC|nr:hypothetical protein Acr_03g0006550 [Actinidia rufa]